MTQDAVWIFDTTLRDGEQSPGCSMNLAEKLTLARQLERLGVDVIEAGFPIASEGDFEAVRAIARDLRHSYGTLVVVVFALLLLIQEPSVTLFAIGIGYGLSGPIEWLWRRKTRRPLEETAPPAPSEAPPRINA